jgi:hypothetical protein
VLAQWTNEAIKGGKQPTPNAVGRYMTKLGWAQQVQRVRGAPRGVSENVWVWEDEVAKATREDMARVAIANSDEIKARASEKTGDDDEGAEAQGHPAPTQD